MYCSLFFTVVITIWTDTVEAQGTSAVPQANGDISGLAYGIVGLIWVRSVN